MTAAEGFIDKNGLWTDAQKRQAEEIRLRLERDHLKFVRVAWADPHGASRAKLVTIPAFLSALRDGYTINVATAMLDASGARTFSSFVRGGGVGLDEMTGSPNLVIVPDPATFRVLPWEPEIGWVLCDEYFVSGVPFHFAPRQLLRRQLRRLEQRGLSCLVGLEVEWYLLRAAEEHLTADHVGAPGIKGRAIRTFPAEPGFSLHSETNLDLMQRPLNALADAYERLHLPLRSIENEWGPGQVECTFAPRPALEAADNLVLFRTATRQIVRRMGFLATFMCRPALKGYYSSGWHLHQSLTRLGDGRNLFAPDTPGDALSPLGLSYLAGLLHSALASTVFANPTINAYGRFRANSLAPDRLAWGIDHRGALLRVLSGVGDPASRIENRIGEPSANPYLYILSQIVSGLDGIDNNRAPPPPDTEPYAAERAMLPKSLAEALVLLERDPLYKDQLGNAFVDYYLRLKRTEVARYERAFKDKDLDRTDDLPTDWEQDEYFDFF